MARARTVFRCDECGAEWPKWVGRCDGCGGWNSLTEHEVAATASTVALDPLSEGRPPVPLDELGDEGDVVVPTGLDELDRVLGGGLVGGSVTLLGGEPGVGKSTVVLQAVSERARRGEQCLYVTGEESAQQVGRRARRLGAARSGVLLLAETSLPRVVAQLESLRPSLCVVDSIQTLHDPTVESAPGTATQVRDCAHRLVAVAKATGTTVVLVGHVTKEGVLAGPRVLEHVVDTVLVLEGDRHGEMRVLRAVKHRFGSTQEIGLFRLGGEGFESVDDPSALFLSDRQRGIPGSVVSPAIEGRRPLLVEVQALVTPTQLPQPRRSAQGLDSGRLSVVLAVLNRHADVSVVGNDVYSVAVGGVRVTEPGVDLAVAMAVASSVRDVPVPPWLVAVGEVGLGGEVRRVSGIEQRVGEAARHGFTHAVVPGSAPPSHPDIELIHVRTVDDALDLIGA